MFQVLNIYSIHIYIYRYIMIHTHIQLSIMFFSLGDKFSNSFLFFEIINNRYSYHGFAQSYGGIPWDLPCNCGLSVCEAYERPAADSVGPGATGSNLESCCRHQGSTALFPVTDPGRVWGQQLGCVVSTKCRNSPWVVPYKTSGVGSTNCWSISGLMMGKSKVNCNWVAILGLTFYRAVRERGDYRRHFAANFPFSIYSYKFSQLQGISTRRYW